MQAHFPEYRGKLRYLTPVNSSERKALIGFMLMINAPNQRSDILDVPACVVAGLVFGSATSGFDVVLSVCQWSRSFCIDPLRF
jgi:hypothetical protein